MSGPPRSSTISARQSNPAGAIEIRRHPGSVPRPPRTCGRLIKWSEVVVPDQGPKGDRFILVHGHPGWRIEHGLQLLLKNEQLLWVGRADQALFMDSVIGPRTNYLPGRPR